MDKLFVMGGEGEGSNYLNDTWSSTDGNKWFQEGVKNEDDDGITSWCPRKGHAVAVLNEKLYIMGGVTIQSMIKYCDNDERIPENDGGGCEEAASEATSEVQQSTTTSCSLSPSFLPNSELSQVYLCDCVVLSYKSKLIVIIRDPPHVQSIEPKNLYIFGTLEMKCKVNTTVPALPYLCCRFQRTG